MNAYIASFMLLLFNAVGFAVPTAAAAQERMATGVSTSAEVADADSLERCKTTKLSGIEFSGHRFCGMAFGDRLTLLAAVENRNAAPYWALAAVHAETGDKLEHVEGAP
ncbi:hypothetical protein [Parasphingorhabdus halotolerans]|uniref:Uncharacterized protein n=1 Tax=Parasphingorhabdus halotolerans TaxID=2725558 RepID=A0A6H2DK58_9SPHN|nr:hypothetical protein [Parasphingorhabdus halotolerans]QJB68131.1 hypothetical protein HF685_01415 [Parasphingorhabdus halotolerans]